VLLALQAEGQDFALRSPERLWALVNFKSGPTHLGTTDVVIRMNYTTVPRTWVPVNKWKRHLSVSRLSSAWLAITCCSGCMPSEAWYRRRMQTSDGDLQVHYKEYLSSGFLSLQVCIRWRQVSVHAARSLL
jgi:hypothetical protein